MAPIAGGQRWTRGRHTILGASSLSASACLSFSHISARPSGHQHWIVCAKASGSTRRPTSAHRQAIVGRRGCQRCAHWGPGGVVTVCPPLPVVRRLTTAGGITQDGKLNVIDMRTGEVVTTIAAGGSVNACGMDADSFMVATGCSNKLHRRVSATPTGRPPLADCRRALQDSQRVRLAESVCAALVGRRAPGRGHVVSGVPVATVSAGTLSC